MQSNVNLRCDARAATALAQGLSKGTRHVNVKHLRVKNLFKHQENEMSRIPTEINVADIGFPDSDWNTSRNGCTNILL